VTRAASLLAIAAILSAAGLFSGCGAAADPYGRLPVKGSVTLDGTALPSGEIVFTSDSVVPLISGTKIVNGQFAIPKDQGLAPGVYKVTINSILETAHPSGDVMNHPTEFKELIPEEFNKKSKLTAEVQNAGENTFSFDVVTKAKSKP